MGEQIETNGEVQEHPFDLKEYWNIILKRRLIIGASLALCVGIAIAVSLLSKPTYRATVVVNVEREKASPVDIGAPAAYSGYDPEFLPTQTRLIQSREIAERVVQRLKLTTNRAFTAQKSGFFSRGENPTDLESVAVAVQESISTTPIRRTNLVEVSAEAPTPALAADIANAVTEAYIDWNVESKFLVVGQASRFLTSQIEQLKSEVQEKERQLQAYGRQNDIVSTDPEGNVTLQKLESFNRDYAEAVADRVKKEARYYELQTAKPEAIADSLSNGFVSQLRNDQAKLERDYADKLNLYKPDWPAMQQLRAQIEKSKQHLASVIQETVLKARDVARTEYQTAQRREQSIKNVLQGQKNEAMTLNSNAVEYNNLKTEVETKRALLDTLLKRQAETEISSRLRGERLSNVRVVDKALKPKNRYSPSYRKNGMLGILAGLALGLGLAFLLEYLDRSLRTLEQVEKSLGVPALGLIPAVGAASTNVYSYGRARSARRRAGAASGEQVAIELLPHAHPRSTVAEAYRAFRTALLLSRAGGLKSMVITSTSPGEGKTSTAVNLSVVLAQLGKRVLLVDADLHKPRVHEVFTVSNRVGLVSVLAENLDLMSALKTTNIPNLFVVPAGPTSPNPSGLLSSNAMAQFIENAVHNYDYVILDAPPVGAVADAIILGAQVDGAILCVRGGKTSRDLVTRTRDRLTRANVRILGVLLNNLEARDSEYGYDYYSGTRSAGYTDDLPGPKAMGA